MKQGSVCRDLVGRGLLKPTDLLARPIARNPYPAHFAVFHAADVALVFARDDGEDASVYKTVTYSEDAHFAARVIVALQQKADENGSPAIAVSKGLDIGRQMIEESLALRIRTESKAAPIALPKQRADYIGLAFWEAVFLLFSYRAELGKDNFGSHAGSEQRARYDMVKMHTAQSCARLGRLPFALVGQMSRSNALEDSSDILLRLAVTRQIK